MSCKCTSERIELSEMEMIRSTVFSFNLIPAESNIRKLIMRCNFSWISLSFSWWQLLFLALLNAFLAYFYVLIKWVSDVSIGAWYQYWTGSVPSLDIFFLLLSIYFVFINTYKETLNIDCIYVVQIIENINNVPVPRSRNDGNKCVKRETAFMLL